MVTKVARSGFCAALLLAPLVGSAREPAESPRPMPGIAIELATDSTVRGRTWSADPAKHRVVIWAKADIYYVQPTALDPWTQIQADSSWESSTHPADRYVALLVDSSYAPAETRGRHPASDPGVLAWDEAAIWTGSRRLDFAGHRWQVKASGDRAVAPGPNHYSDLPSDVWVDEAGLHLTIGMHDDRPYATEVVLTRPLGYGEYTFQLDSRVDDLDPRAVFAGFVYEAGTREIDVEFSRALAGPHNAQYVVQPYTRRGNIHRFDLGEEVPTSHRFTWLPGSVRFVSWRGVEDEPRPETTLQSWTYEGAGVPPPGAFMRFDFWMVDGEAPGEREEVVIRSFRHRTLP
jgi:hypothetical protein